MSEYNPASDPMNGPNRLFLQRTQPKESAEVEVSIELSAESASLKTKLKLLEILAKAEHIVSIQEQPVVEVSE